MSDINAVTVENQEFVPELKEKSGKKSGANTAKVDPKEHEIKIAVNKLVREAGAAGIPIFVSYYSQNEGYVYNAMLPEEIATEAVASQYGKFDEFMRTCIGFNKDEEFKSEIVRISK